MLWLAVIAFVFVFGSGGDVLVVVVGAVVAAVVCGRLWEAQFVVFYVSGRLWEAQFVVFYVSGRLWEAQCVKCVVFYVSGSSKCR